MLKVPIAGCIFVFCSVLLSPVPAFALEKGCEKVMVNYVPEIHCNCGFRENASYPPRYEEYMQEGTVWEKISLDQVNENYDHVLSDGRLCQLEGTLYRDYLKNKKDETLQQL